MIKNKLILISIFFSTLTIVGQTATEIAKTGIKSTVSIVALDNISQPLGYGSGFIIDDELIVTNVHVIEGCNSAYVLLNGEEKKYKVTGYVAIDKADDLVILKVSGLYGTKLSLASATSPEIGEKIYAVGNPKGLNGTFSEGIISGIRDLQSNQVLQITAPISPGSSGGPVLNSSGQVIGIAFASFTSGQNLNFAIPVKFLLNLKANISSIIPISTVKAQHKTISTTSITPNIKEGVSIRNLQVSSCCIGGDGILIPFSIKNNLGQYINNIKILFLAYDASGVVIDYNEYTFSGGIEPFLAKSVGCSEFIELKGKVSTIKSRILDFKIVEK